MSKRILIIDDDQDILEILEFIFTDHGYVPIIYHTGKSATEVELLRPDIILLDVRINGFAKTGAEICYEFKSSPLICHIPILLVSAEHNLDVIARNYCADGYICKPFDIDPLITKVKEFLY